MQDVPLMHKPLAAARRIGVGRSKLFELLAAGEIESVKVGRARLVPEAALVEYVDRLRKRPKAAA
ncbi:excisionase family DNA-binding protein [Micromonospora marina]|uniref:excisionase family DNA-binding protein n=1 Tax=Micromonospora marina TaxID=307120 RepID=UPI003454A18D